MRVTTRATAAGSLGAMFLLVAERAEATVPIDPQFLPDAALLLVGVFAGAIALHRLFTRQLGSAMRAGAVCLASTTLAFVLAGNCHKQTKKPAGLLPAAESSMSLVLGDVLLRVAPSERYVLSVDGKEFLELELQRTGLVVSCVVGSRNEAATGIRQNTFPISRSGIRPSRPDTHTLLVQDEGKDIFRVHYSEPRRIEITGQLTERKSTQPALISFQKGIYWSGGAVPPGTVIDLKDQGKGRIDFGPSGLIRIVSPS